MKRAAPLGRTALDPTEAAAAVVLAVTSGAVFLLMTQVIGPLLSESGESAEIGAMWAVISTIFVFHMSFNDRLQGAKTRLAATAMSLVVCLVYLLLFPVTALGIGVVIGVSSLLAVVIRQPQDAALTAITSTVVLIVADLGQPDTRWLQPLLRLLDTAVGIAIGLAAAAGLGWVCSQRRN